MKNSENTFWGPFFFFVWILSLYDSWVLSHIIGRSWTEVIRSSRSTSAMIKHFELNTKTCTTKRAITSTIGNCKRVDPDRCVPSAPLVELVMIYPNPAFNIQVFNVIHKSIQHSKQAVPPCFYIKYQLELSIVSNNAIFL